MADQKISELTAATSLTDDDLIPLVDDPAGTPATKKITWANLKASLGNTGFVIPGFSQFRLTTESGVPISTSDRTSQSTIYLTPYSGNAISIYDGSDWQYRQTAEISLGLSSLTSGKNYDVWANWTGSAVALSLSTAWTDDTTRADAIAQQDGVWVKSGAATYLLVGTIRTTGTTTTEDSAAKRYVANSMNATDRSVSVVDTTASWTQASADAAWRQARSTATNQVDAVFSLPGLVDILAMGAPGGSSAYGVGVGVGVSSTSVNSAQVTVGGAGSSGVANASARLVTRTGPGRYYFPWLEHGHTGATITWYGQEASGIQSGVVGRVQN